MAIYARYQATTMVKSGGFFTVALGAHIEVRSEVPGQPLVALKQNRDGSSGLSNPFNADANGFFAFHVVGGSYQIKVYTDGGDEQTLRYVPIGLNAESDSISQRTQREVTAAGAVTIDAADADIVVINKSVGAATTVNLPSAAVRTTPVMIVDGKGDAGTNNITIVPVAGQKVYGTVDFQPKIDGNGGSLILTPKADGSGWF